VAGEYRTSACEPHLEDRAAKRWYHVELRTLPGGWADHDTARQET